MSKITTLAKPTLVNKSKSEIALAFAENNKQQPQADIATTRLNANIKLELHTALKVRAATEGTTIGALIEEWINGWKK